WETDGGREVNSFSDPGRPGSVHGLAFSPDGRRVAFGVAGWVGLWDFTAPDPPATILQLTGQTARSLAVSPDGRLLALGTPRGGGRRRAGRGGPFRSGT